MAPIVPGLSSHPARLARTIQAIADHGATFVGTFLLHLEGGTRTHLLEFLRREYPDWVEGYGRLYAGKYVPETYALRVRSVLGALKARYGVARQRRAEKQPTLPAPDATNPPCASSDSACSDASPQEPATGGWRRTAFLTQRLSTYSRRPECAEGRRTLSLRGCATRTYLINRAGIRSPWFMR